PIRIILILGIVTHLRLDAVLKLAIRRAPPAGPFASNRLFVPAQNERRGRRSRFTHPEFGLHHNLTDPAFASLPDALQKRACSYFTLPANRLSHGRQRWINVATEF